MAAAAVEKRYRLSSGQVMCISEYGDPSGTPLLYFHGWPSSSVQAASMHAVALRRKLRVIAMDRPGLGQSDNMEGRRLVDWPALMDDLTAQMGISKCHALGVSGGGLYTLVLAHARDDRLLSASVVCGAPSLAATGNEQVLPWFYKTLLWVRRRCPWLLWVPFALGVELAQQPKHKFPKNLLLRRELGERDRLAMLEYGELEVITESFIRAWRGTVDPILTDADVYVQPPGFNLAEVRYPVHFWHGDADRAIPMELARRMADLVPGAVRHWVPNEGHFSLPVFCMEAILDAAGGGK
jgi:pimeloyl-ACP methyl ester carboxylesterase